MDLSKTVEPGLDETTQASFTQPEAGDYGNKLVYLGYRKEDHFCPEGQVLDVYGYCREVYYLHIVWKLLILSSLIFVVFS